MYKIINKRSQKDYRGHVVNYRSNSKEILIISRHEQQNIFVFTKDNLSIGKLPLNPPSIKRWAIIYTSFWHVNIQPDLTAMISQPLINVSLVGVHRPVFKGIELWLGYNTACFHWPGYSLVATKENFIRVRIYILQSGLCYYLIWLAPYSWTLIYRL